MLRARVSTFWKAHGTKLLGFGSWALGLVAFIDHETVHLIAETFGPVWAPRFEHGLLILGGLMVAKRGYTNQQNSAPQG